MFLFGFDYAHNTCKMDAKTTLLLFRVPNHISLKALTNAQIALPMARTKKNKEGEEEEEEEEEKAEVTNIEVECSDKTRRMFKITTLENSMRDLVPVTSTALTKHNRIFRGQERIFTEVIDLPALRQPGSNAHPPAPRKHLKLRYIPVGASPSPLSESRASFGDESRSKKRAKGEAVVYAGRNSGGDDDDDGRDDDDGHDEKRKKRKVHFDDDAAAKEGEKTARKHNPHDGKPKHKEKHRHKHHQ